LRSGVPSAIGGAVAVGVEVAPGLISNNGAGLDVFSSPTCKSPLEWIALNAKIKITTATAKIHKPLAAHPTATAQTSGQKGTGIKCPVGSL
jgi:hypothetical protein